MISNKTVPMMIDSVTAGATGGGVMEILEDIDLGDSDTESTVLKVIVSIFSAFIVPALRTWIKNRKLRREQRRKLKAMQSPSIYD